MEIINNNNEFLLKCITAKEITVIINLTKRIIIYNKSIYEKTGINNSIIDKYCYDKFSKIELYDEKQFTNHFNYFMKNYGLTRNSTIKKSDDKYNKIINNLFDYIKKIRKGYNYSFEVKITEDFVNKSKNDFEIFRTDLKNILLRNEIPSPIFTSKLLHFIFPNKFWLFDSRVGNLLSICDFDKNDSEYGIVGNFFSKIIKLKLYPELCQHLQQIDSNYSNILKVFDKVLFV